ncbi:hypothetical protein ACTFIZ_009477 [Dictyostelium cf. discoideum]
MSLINKNYFIPKKIFLEKDDFILISNGGIIPESFEKIALSFESPKLNEITFHKNVKFIYFLDNYQHDIKKEMFPSSINGIVFYNIKNLLSSDSIPESIKFLGFNGYKNQITKQFVKSSVTTLGIGGDMGYPLDKHLLNVSSIKTLCFDGNYPHEITNDSIIDHLDNLFIMKTKLPLNENSLKNPLNIYPPTIPKNIFFYETYKFPIIGKIFPKIESTIISFNINITNVKQPITNEIFEGLPINYHVYIGWGYRHKLDECTVDSNERFLSFGNVVHPVPEKFLSKRVRFYNGFSHQIKPFPNNSSMYELVLGNVKYPITKDILPSPFGVGELTIEKGYDFKLTPDLFENVRSLKLFDVKSTVFTKKSLPKSNCVLGQVSLRCLEFPFDLSFFPTDIISKMILFNCSQVIGTNQLPKSLSSLSLINCKIDPKIIIPESVTHLKIENIDQQLTKESIPINLKVFELLVYKFSISKDLFPDTVHYIVIGETINPFTIEMVPTSLKHLVSAHDYKFLPFDKPLLKYYYQ